ncbi:MAG TPA: outer membrane lipoprotein chaperone LolA [Gammaproteobacteria bacterium]|nr:outer membrane lipoprotein chaperone LolA [Gammaproteobacteria bacterium]
MIKHFLLCTFCFLLAFPAYAGNAQGPLEKFLQDLESFKADFTQTLSNEHGEVLETSSGVVYMQSPQKFRWVYQEPYSQLIITDGTTLWMYDEDLQQVTIHDVSETIDSTPAAIISGQENIDAYYIKNAMGEIEGADWIELTPRNVDSQYSSIRLGFDNGELAMMILFDNLGQVTRIDFSNISRNKRFGGPLFTFSPPDNVDVIDDRQKPGQE